MSHKIPPEGEKGFSLVEVLVAFSLLSLVLATYLTVTAQALRTEGGVSESSVARIHEASILAQAGVVFSLQDGTHRGNWPDGWQWKMEVSPSDLKPVGLSEKYRVVQLDLTLKSSKGRVMPSLSTHRLVGTDTGLLP